MWVGNFDAHPTYVLKGAAVQELCRAMALAADGEVVLTPAACALNGSEEFVTRPKVASCESERALLEQTEAGGYQLLVGPNKARRPVPLAGLRSATENKKHVKEEIRLLEKKAVLELDLQYVPPLLLPPPPNATVLARME